MQGFNPFQVVCVPGGTSWSTLVVFHEAVQASQHRFLERLSFVHCLLLAPWSQMGCPCMFELGSGLSILLHGSVCLFLGPDCAFSVPSASSSMLKSESVIRPALFVFLRFLGLFRVSCCWLETVGFSLLSLWQIWLQL